MIGPYDIALAKLRSFSSNAKAGHGKSAERDLAEAQVHATLAVADELRTATLVELLKTLDNPVSDLLEWDDGTRLVAEVRTRLGLDS